MLIDELVKSGAVKFGDFTLTSGKKSKYYVDIKRASSNPRVLGSITEGFSSYGVEADKVAGVELGAVPLIVAYSLQNELPFIIIRKKGREHGTRKGYEGQLNPGERVLLLEDVITSGGSVLRAIDIIEEAGGEVVKVLTVVDRQEGGTEPVNRRSSLGSLVTAEDLLNASEKKI